MSMLIPKIIHRIWTVWNPNQPKMPKLYEEFDLILKTLHPDWQIIEWNETKILDFITKFYPEFLPTYLSYDAPVKQHDASRYLIIHHFGGVFIQHSLKFQKNIEPLLEDIDLVLTNQVKAGEYNSVWNGFFASIPHHNFLQYVIDRLASKAKLEVLKATGPDFLTAITKEYLNKTNDNSIKILHNQYLVPFDWEEKNSPLINSMCIKDHSKCFELYPDSYSFCQWSAAWKNSHEALVDTGGNLGSENNINY